VEFKRKKIGFLRGSVIREDGKVDVEKLENLLNWKEPFVKAFALGVVREFRLKEFAGQARILAYHKDVRVRANAIEALGVIGDPARDCQIIQKGLNSKDRRVVAASFKVLSLWDPEKTVEYLERMYEASSKGKLSAILKAIIVEKEAVKEWILDKVEKETDEEIVYILLKTLLKAKCSYHDVERLRTLVKSVVFSFKVRELAYEIWLAPRFST